LRFQVEKQGGHWFGPVCRVANDAIHEEGSIHDDEIARESGFRGGLVAGTNHLELFPFVVREAFGRKWFEKGSLSIYFRVPTTHLEPARAVVGEGPGQPDDFQVDAWIQRPEGERIGEGSLAVGAPGLPTALGRRDLGRFDTGDYQVIAGVEVGDTFEEEETVVSGPDMQSRIELQEAPPDWWSHDSPWEDAVISPALCVNRMYHPAEIYATKKKGIAAVPMFGAIEVRNVNGPALVGRRYTAGGRVVARGASPRTEYFWYEGFMAEPEGRVAVSMLMQLRFMRKQG